MGKNKEQSSKNGDEVMKAIGELNSNTSNLKTETQSKCKTDPEEVGSWITAIGKALISILK